MTKQLAAIVDLMIDKQAQVIKLFINQFKDLEFNQQLIVVTKFKKEFSAKLFVNLGQRERIQWVYKLLKEASEDIKQIDQILASFNRDERIRLNLDVKDFEEVEEVKEQNLNIVFNAVYNQLITTLFLLISL